MKIRLFFYIFIALNNLALASFNFTDADVNISANSLEYYDGDKIIIAKGDVEIIQEKEKLYADKIIYNSVLDKVTAIGNVKLYESTGYLINANELELTGDFKKGIIKNLKIIFPDKSIMLGKSAIKESNNISKVSDADYTPCKFVCDEKSPLWSIQAQKVTVDKNNEKIVYRNGFFKIKKMPVLYLPYFSHPTPNAKRKSGFLAAQFIQNTYLGQSVKVPYYYVINDNQDITITPQISSRRGVIMHGEHRVLHQNGASQTIFNFTKKTNNKDDKDKKSKINNFRGYLGSEGKYSLVNQYSLLYDINLTTDKTYLKNYLPLGKEKNEANTLISKVAFEKFDTNNFFSGKLLYFQDLTEDIKSLGRSQKALPSITTESKIMSLPDKSSILLKTNFLSLYNPDSNSYNRAIFEILWKKQYYTSQGLLINFTGEVRKDIYNYFDKKPDNKNNFVTRTIPKLIINTSYPIVKNTENYNFLLEPISSLILVPKKNYNKNISNEDALSTELSDVNLFSSNIFSGKDFVESNYRFSYGLKGNLSSNSSKSAEFLIGQSYADYNSNFIKNIESKHSFSDIIGRVSGTYYKTSIGYHFTLSKDNLSVKKQSISVSQQYKMMMLNVNYISNKDNITNIDGTKNLREIEGEVSFKKVKDWNVAFKVRKNLTSKKENPNLKLHGSRLISTGVHLQKENECIKLDVSLSRDYTHMQGKKPSNTWLARLWLKNLI